MGLTADTCFSGSSRGKAWQRVVPEWRMDPGWVLGNFAALVLNALSKVQFNMSLEKIEAKVLNYVSYRIPFP
jgi:hypothetical protein